MAIMIREDLSSNEGLHVLWNYKKGLQTTESVNFDPISPNSIMVDYEAIHVGMTRNFTFYTEEALKSSVPTWTKPYLRPLIMHHNEKDGKIIGRIHHADYTDKNTLSKTGTLLLTANVPDKEGIEGIQDGRLKTTSIGAIVHDAECSVCGQNIAEYGPCEHERGVEYDGKLCYWIIKKMEAKELSYVIVPSDIYSQHIKVYKPEKGKVSNVQETVKKGVLNVEENKIVTDVTESTVVDENGEAAKVEQPVVAEPVDTKKYETEIATLKQEKLDLEVKVKDLEKALKEEQEAKADLAKTLEATQILLTKANEDIVKVKAALTTKEEALTKEIALRESLESQLVLDKVNKRNQLVESVMDLRAQLNKRVIAKEDLEKKSDEFLQESLIDLQEELSLAKPTAPSVTEQIEELPQVTNPGIVENVEENNKPIVKEEKASSNINVEEAIADLMSAIMVPNKNRY